MFKRRSNTPGERGQILVMAAVAIMFVMVPMVGLVVDGGYALAQRRASQNASDFGALSGARVIAAWVSGDLANGTDANVQAAISAAVTANGGAPVRFGAPLQPGDPEGPRYVGNNGTSLGYVGASTYPPAGTVGVTVSSTRSWRPFFLGIVGMNSWDAGAQATAKGGYAAGGPSGDVFPAGIAQSFFDTFGFCTGPVSTDPTSPCYPKQLTPGNLNVPGGFGWLKFGATGKCDDYGLGMLPEGCEENNPFLQEEMGPPTNSHGCCDQVSGDQDLDRIGSLPGNKVSVDCSYYIDNKVTVTVPVWDYAGGTGAGAYYHIVGFSGFQITECRGGKDIAGVWRKPFFLGPTTSTPGFPGTALAVQLVK